MTDQFFVDADGLDGGRDGFDGKSAELRTLAQYLQSLSNPGRIQDAAGNDKNGNDFAKTHIQSSAEIYNGITAWALAVEATRDAIGDMAKSFRDVDQGAYDASNALFKSFTDLNAKVRRADPGDGQDSLPEDYDRQARMPESVLAQQPATGNGGQDPLPENYDRQARRPESVLAQQPATEGGGSPPVRTLRKLPADPGEEPLPRLHRRIVEQPEEKLFVRSEKPTVKLRGYALEGRTAAREEEVAKPEEPQP
ncbi:hypothetical protein [Amycolatopsis benzoatilytica]|uniref:hypothetical protein n=1 Tax=Amycolatopsis benzoatilytica TaxID=346045 RepID=UPI00036ADB1F|nr:hypothetical protein [Amycolatopsis benzoatilytica]